MNSVLAQSAAPGAVSAAPVGWFVILLAAAVGVLVLVMILVMLAARSGHLRREWEHAERMRAIEMGMPVAPKTPAWPMAWVCTTIGAGVPLAAFFFTWMAHDRPGVADEIWIAPGVVSVTSVISASILAGFLFGSGSGPNASPGHRVADNGAAMKPTADPDAIDVVGRRG